jgi:hypothetical protein
MTTQRVTIGKHGGHLWIIKKGGKEIAYAETKKMAQWKADKIRKGEEW